MNENAKYQKPTEYTKGFVLISASIQKLELFQVNIK
jgi:hypothetical protein